LSDASVFPTSLGANPQITVMTVSTIIARAALKAG
jgi:choline dehydrogenase-like flavoprotein